MSVTVFVYGTLKPGQPRWPALAPFAIEPGIYSASVPGRLFDTGYGWPAAVFDAGVGARVPGVVVALHPDLVDEALAVLDEIEGVDSGLFRRIRVGVDGESCWAYQWPGATDMFEPITLWGE